MSKQYIEDVAGKNLEDFDEFLTSQGFRFITSFENKLNDGSSIEWQKYTHYERIRNIVVEVHNDRLGIVRAFTVWLQSDFANSTVVTKEAVKDYLERKGIK